MMAQDAVRIVDSLESQEEARMSARERAIASAELIIREYSSSELDLTASGSPTVPVSLERAEGILYDVRNLALGAELPDIAAPDIDGLPERLSDHRGKVVLVDFWATWCAPCKVAIPEFVRLKDELGERGFEIVSFSIDESLDEVRGVCRAR